MIHNFRHHFGKAFTAFLAVLALLGAARAALADGYEEGVARQRVTYADLNLDRATDAEALYVRLQHAAARVCYADLSSYTQINFARRSCVRHAVADAVARIDHPNLTAAHAARQTGVAQIAALR